MKLLLDTHTLLWWFINDRRFMKILITGAAGFIGMHVAQRLLARGDEVVGIDNLNDYYDVGLKEARLAQLADRPGFRFVRSTSRIPPAWPPSSRRSGFDGVINLAAQAGVRYSLINPHAYAQTNLVGFVNLLEGCRHGKVEATSSTPAVPASTAATRRCRSPSTTASTTRSASTPPRRSPTS
jgi:nucleoside-diphosphate-sugar epimerase